MDLTELQWVGNLFVNISWQILLNDLFSKLLGVFFSLYSRNTDEPATGAPRHSCVFRLQSHGITQLTFSLLSIFTRSRLCRQNSLLCVCMFCSLSAAVLCCMFVVPLVVRFFCVCRSLWNASCRLFGSCRLYNLRYYFHPPSFKTLSLSPGHRCKWEMCFRDLSDKYKFSNR